MIVLTLNCTRLLKNKWPIYVRALDGLGTAHCQSTAMHEQARAEQEKAVFSDVSKSSKAEIPQIIKMIRGFLPYTFVACAATMAEVGWG